MRALIVGGFEPSGHDSKQKAMEEGAQRSSIEYRSFTWRTVVDTGHPVFHLHRIGARSGMPGLASLLDDSRIADALTHDVGDDLDLSDTDVVVSVHPWSTMICASVIRREGLDVLLVDLHGEFSPGPIPLVRVDEVGLFVGVEMVASLSPTMRRRVRRTGVPVRSQFADGVDDIFPRRALTVSCGHGGWSIDAAMPTVRLMVDRTEPREIFCVGAVPPAVADLGEKRHLTVTPCGSASSIALALRQSRYAVTKASGTNIAECLSSGTVAVCPPSGVFWEDEARAYLSAIGAIVPSELAGEIDLASAVASVGTRDRLRCRVADAAVSAWTCIAMALRGHPQADDPSLGQPVGLVEEILADVESHDRSLREVSRVVAELLRAWR